MSAGTVIVTGRRSADRELIKTVIAPFVTTHAAPDRMSGLLLRQPPTGICPVTFGLSPAFNAFVTRRIVEVTKMVGAVVKPARKCRPDVQVVFTTDPQGLVNTLSRRTNSDILGVHYVSETKALSRVSRAIQAWYVTGTISDTGPYAVTITTRGGAASPTGLVKLDDAYEDTTYSGLGSHIPPRNSSQIVSTLIVVDSNKVEGREIGPISDYIAMLALSQAQSKSLDMCGPLPSILDLMAAGCQTRPAPESLTEGDIAFLKALYSADITTSGKAAGVRIERSMAKALGRAALDQAKSSTP